ncbi:BTB/POZ domain and ankyrin repeat-containing protein NPR1-like [Phoenix dactylifera]|uniref:BTB/POZ domain and ankyrin repeat-containing protein NPR1-like n=1 Tax=Phoenix dactylifera TaxID=42345 RepID=A0A8B9AJ33_PHODC|nr:BTB/POZ domain and ankyrin repeat-containing protein NPR1-like [Phoenix dactylifera]
MEVSHLTAATAFSDSDNGSTVCFSDAIPAAASVVESATADVEALRRLSDNLGSLFQSPDFDFCADASIAVAGSPLREVRAHRCVLSTRSPFFREVFARREKGVPAKLELRELVRDLEVGYEALVAVLGYLYRGRVGPLPRGFCSCVDEECSHEGCRPAVDFMVQVLYASFTFEISELVNLFQRHLLDILKKVAIDDIPVILNVANMCSKSCARLLTKCIEIVAKSDLDFITLDKALPPDIVKQIMDLRLSIGIVWPEISGFPNKHVKSIHRALDSDDVELVRMLLTEGHTSLDDSYALHYAVAHCDSKITTEVLDLGLADVNHRNLRGYTVLHIAAMRREPQIIVSLLTKGARPSDLTLDGRKALEISKRLTKSVDYYRSTEEGKASPKDGLCIEILEQAERRDPLIGEASVSLAMAGDDLRGRLLYLENRVALARVLFPMEAKVAMDIAQVDGTMEFTLGSTSNHTTTNQRTSVVLNETPFRIRQEYLARMIALSRTVELGKRFFRRCSEVLNKIMDDDYTELTSLGQDGSEERRKRYLELQDALIKAFSEDKEEFDRSARSSSSSKLRSRR